LCCIIWIINYKNVTAVSLPKVLSIKKYDVKARTGGQAETASPKLCSITNMNVEETY